jgi:hypothetical protein
MPKKPDKIESKKVGKLESTESVDSLDAVKRVEKVGNVQSVDAASSVGTVARSAGVVRHQFSIEDKEKLFQVVEDEAQKLFGSSSLSPEKRQLIEQAVKVAIESGLIQKDEG